jgi:hypothetical protein
MSGSGISGSRDFLGTREFPTKITYLDVLGNPDVTLTFVTEVRQNLRISTYGVTRMWRPFSTYEVTRIWRLFSMCEVTRMWRLLFSNVFIFLGNESSCSSCSCTWSTWTGIVEQSRCFVVPPVVPSTEIRWDLINPVNIAVAILATRGIRFRLFLN